MDAAPLLQVDDLHVTFATPTGPVHAVRGLSLGVSQGEILGVVGESGCGKSVTFRALLGLAPQTAHVTGEVTFDGEVIATDGSLAADTAMIYQNPGAALNPVFTIGQQLELASSKKDRETLATLLDQVGLPEPERSLDAYPHEFSGGMRQRAVIAFALAQEPRLLIADEPTTALDVTTQAQVLELLRTIRKDSDLTIILISHDLSVIRRLCDRVAVLYAGKVVEAGPAAEVLRNPQHPYTKALLASTPSEATVGGELASIPGMVPDGRTSITGCLFAPRCAYAREACTEGEPSLRATESAQHAAACILIEDAS